MIVLALLMPIVFWIASRLLQKQLLDPLFNLRGEAGAIAQGDLNQAIANTDRRDEIGQLATSFAAMRDAVRRTIIDLKDTNISIERFVPHAFLAIVGKPSIVEVELGDNKRRNMTILFSDIRNFTTLSERMTPDENFAFINAYLERMGPVIRDHNGFIDKYIGDAIMALFESADDALRAGLGMLETLEAFNAERRAAGQTPIGIGIGINTGILMMGTIGEKHRMDGTVISDAVNLASRIESLTKDLSRRPADLAVHLEQPRRSQGLRHPPDRRRRGQGQDPAGHDLRGVPARPARPARRQGPDARPAAGRRRGAGAQDIDAPAASSRSAWRKLPGDMAASQSPEEVRLKRQVRRRLPVDRVDMDVGAVDHGKAAVVAGEGQEQVGAAQHDRLGAALAAEPAAGLEEGLALLVGDPADARHVAVALLDALEFVAFGRDDLGLGDAAVELALHDDARADDAHAASARAG